MKDKSIASYINPDFIILKPSFVGGIQATRDWIDWASTNGKEWWITSALESNIGLQAIAHRRRRTTNVGDGPIAKSAIVAFTETFHTGIVE